MNHRTQNDSTTSVKKAIQHQVGREMLNTEQLQQLMLMQQAALNKGTKESNKVSKQIWLNVAAICAALMLSITLVWQLSVMTRTQDHTWDIALEVVKNHLKLKPLDIKAQSIHTLQQYFTHLDFSLINSEIMENRFALPEQFILGGRYCSIKGVTAAQLRYRQSNQVLSTLYEVAYDRDSFGFIPNINKGELPKRLFIKGLQVSMWVEKGLLMVLVTDV